MQDKYWQWVGAFLACLCGGWLPATATAQEPPVSAAAATTEPKPPERLIYLPYKNLRAVFENEGAAAFLPFREYLALWDKAWGSISRTPEQPPVAGVITSAEYVAAVEQDVARVSATLTVQVLQKGWAEIPLKFGGAAVASITGEPGPVWLRGTGAGTYSLLLSTAGEHRVKLELTARVLTSPEGRSLELQVPTVGVTNFEITVPDADQAIELQPKLLAQPVAAAGKTTRVRASVGSTDKITARWHPRVGTKPDMELLASATSAALVQVEDGLIHTDAFFTFEVLRGNLERVRLAVPKGHRILDVASEARVKEWKVAAEENRQVVTVDLLSRMGGKVAVEIHTERTLPEDPFDAAGLQGDQAFGIHALDVLRENGQIALRSGADLVLNVAAQQGLQRVDEGEVDPRLKRPGAAFYKFYSPQCRLTVAAKAVEPRLLANHAAEVTFTDDQIKLATSLEYTIERAGVFELKFKLPADLTVEHVQCDGLKQFDVSPDRETLTVALKERRLGALALQIRAARPFNPRGDMTELTLPVLEPLGVEVENGRLRVLAAEAIDVITETDKIVGFQPDPAADASAPPSFRLVSAWTFTRRPISLPARTVAKPTRLTADVATSLDVKQGQVQVAVALTWHVEYAGLDTFRFAVPEAVADQVQITLAEGANVAIKQKSRAAEAVEGWVTWTVILQRDVLGDVRMRVSYDLVPQAGDAGRAEERATVPLLRVLDPFTAEDSDPRAKSLTVTRTTGEVTVRKDRALAVTATASGGEVEPIDVRELTLLPQDGFVAFRYYKQPVEVSLASSKFEVQDVIGTVVSRGLVEVVLDRSGGATFRSRYQLKSSERQRLRIDLPAGAKPLGVLLDRKPVSLEKNPETAEHYDSYFVNVARTKSSDEPFALAVLYRLKLTPEPFQTNGGELLLRLPLVGGVVKEGAASGVAVQQLRVGLWIPDEYALVGTPEHFLAESRPSLGQLLWGGKKASSHPELQQWIGDEGGGVFDFPVEGHGYTYSNLGGRDRLQVRWWYLPTYTWIIGGALLLVGFVLLRTTWENKLTVLLVAAFCAAAYALQDLDLVMHGVAVAAYGLIAMLALWLIHGVLRGPGRRARASDGPGPLPQAAVIPPPGIFDMVVLSSDQRS